MNEAEHSANNEFVRRTQAEQAKYAGKNPNMGGLPKDYNAEMSNNGERTQSFGKKLTSKMDKCYPVK
jgi:hypothetical protein